MLISKCIYLYLSVLHYHKIPHAIERHSFKSIFHVCVHFLILCGLTVDLVTGLQVSHQMVQRGHGPAVESTVYHTLKYGYHQPHHGYHGGPHGGHLGNYLPHAPPVYQDHHSIVKSVPYHPNTLVYGRKV